MAHDTSQQGTAARAGDPACWALGSGKTTLANRILPEHHDQRIAVIVNEFGDVGIDGKLIVGVEDNIVELSNGCLCCTVQGDLADTLRQLLMRRRQTVDAQPFERIGDSGPRAWRPQDRCSRSCWWIARCARVQVDGVITMVHTKHIVQQLADVIPRPRTKWLMPITLCESCDQCEGDALAAADRPPHLQSARDHRAGQAEVDVVRVLNQQTWDSARVKAALGNGVVCATMTMITTTIHPPRVWAHWRCAPSPPWIYSSPGGCCPVSTRRSPT